MNAPIFLDAQTVRNQIARLLLEHPEVSEDAQLLSDSIEGETDLHEVLTRLVRQERDAAAFSEAIKAQEEVLAGRRARFVRRQQLARELMLSLMEAGSQQKVMLPEATISITNGRLKTVVTDEAAIPPGYFKVKRTPDLTRIGEALSSGVNIPGAHLSNGGISLTIRTR